MIPLGDYREDSTIRIPIPVINQQGGRTDFDLADPLNAEDFKIYKDGSDVEKTSTNGLTVTDSFDGITGLKYLEIDTSNDTGDAGFWTTSSDYMVVLDPDTETIGGEVPIEVWTFSIENRVMDANIVQLLGSVTPVNRLNDWMDGFDLNYLSGTHTLNSFVLGGGPSFLEDELIGHGVVFSSISSIGRTSRRIIHNTAGPDATVYVDKPLPAIPVDGDLNLIVPIGHINNDTSLYQNAIWWDSAASNTGSIFGVDGTPEKPIDDTSALLSLLSTSGYNKVMVKGGLAVDVDVSGVIFENWDGTGSITFTGGNNVSNCIFNKMVVGNGIMAGNPDTKFFECEIINAIAGGVNGFQGKAVHCSLANTIGFADAGTSDFFNCYQAENATVTMAVNDTSQVINVFDFIGSLLFSDAGGSNTTNIYSSGGTKVTLDSLLNGGTYILHGIGNLVNNSGLSPDLTDWEELPLSNISSNISQWDGNPVTGDGDWAELQTDVDAILVDTDEVQQKLPTNNIMGSAVKTDKDDEIDAIKTKTDNLPTDPASETNVNDNEVKIDQVIADIAALNDISPAEVLAQVNAALDAGNIALVAPPNVETGSLREMIQIVAYVAKLGKIETLTLQTLLNEAGGSFATRAISINPTDVTVGKLS